MISDEHEISVNLNNIAIHEAAHCIVGWILGFPSKKICLKKSGYTIAGKTYPIYIFKKTLLGVQLQNVVIHDENRKNKILSHSKDNIIFLIAGESCEKIYSGRQPLYPPDKSEKSDASYCYEIINNICQLLQLETSSNLNNYIFFSIQSKLKIILEGNDDLKKIIIKLSKEIISKTCHTLHFCEIIKFIIINRNLIKKIKIELEPKFSEINIQEIITNYSNNEI